MSSSLGSKLQKSSAISVPAFYDALCSLWLPHLGATRSPSTDRIHMCGIAVSGGMDSMAMAYLCSRVQKDQLRSAIGRFHFIPIIVDHKARNGSGTEVSRTKRRLRDMGLHPSSVPLEWPHGVSPSSLSNFETHARRLRYQALGKACRDQKLDMLLVAHHSDDQAETVLMRLAAGHTGVGLQGMAGTANMPECWGIYGVVHSGATEKVEKRRSLRLRCLHHAPYREETRLVSLLAAPPVFESGGVILLRPLLSFDKEQLRKTCEANNVGWEEDESNNNVSITPRNTVRSLLLNARLPRALQKLSLIQIVQRGRDESRQVRCTINQIARTCKVLSFDTRSGTLVVRLRRKITPHSGRTASYAWLLAAELLRYFARTVSPEEDVAVTSLVSAVKLVFPDLSDSSAPEKSDTGEVLNFTAGGIVFRRVRSQGEISENNHERYALPDPDFIWILARQPFAQLPKPLIIPPRSAKRLSTPAVSSPLQPSPDTLDPYQVWSPWRLWDGRYWIRVRNNTSETLVVRAWQSHEMPDIRQNMTSERFEIFYKTLKTAAPGKVRWTLPVIAKATRTNADDIIKGNTTCNSTNSSETASDITQPEARTKNSPSSSHSGKILVFPSLGTPGWLDILDNEGMRKLEWEVRYKRIELIGKDQQDISDSQDSSSVLAWDNGGQGSDIGLDA